MNILLINHYAGSVIHGMEYRPFYLAREWVKAGHNVTIAAASFSHLRNLQPDFKETVRIEIIEGIKYIWLKTPPYKGNGLKRVFNMLAFIWQLYKNTSMLLKNKPDIVIASSTYPLDIYPASRIAKSAKARLVFEVHDLWPLSPMELSGMSKWHPFIVVMQLAENFAYRNACKVVSLLPKTLPHMLLHGMAADKFVYIPNGVILPEWDEHSSVVLPKEHKTAITQARNAVNFILMYAGGHGLSNALHNLVSAALLLKNQPVKIIMVGQGPEKENLIRATTENNLNNITFLEPVPKEYIPALLQQADVLYIGAQGQPIYRFGVSPNKLFDYMLAAKPVINAMEAGNDPVADSQCGISVPAEAPQAIAEAIIEMMRKSPDEREQMGKRGREYVINNHDYRILAKRFIEEIY